MITFNRNGCSVSAKYATTIEKVEVWLNVAQSSSPVWVAGFVIALLFADLFIAVPTLTVIILSGFFLGHALGAISAIIGLFLAGVSGYGLSRRYGDLLVNFLIKEEHRRLEAQETFGRHGVAIILLSRIIPILPEVSACMAGMTRMPLLKFLLVWLGNVVPYAIIASYAGSISTLENPQPAIYTAIGLTAFLWLSWPVFNTRIKSIR
ncbi:MAG: putative membrane protein YdjX (TVP38/TMEM64 family) [Flavobacteriales bacterium]